MLQDIADKKKLRAQSPERACVGVGRCQDQSDAQVNVGIYTCQEGCRT